MANLVAVSVNFLQEATRLTCNRRVGRIHRNADDVISGRYYWLPISAIQNEVLSTQEETIRIGPPGADALIARNSDRTARTELMIFRRNTVEPVGIWVGVQHAKAALSGLPNETGFRINELVERVVPEMIVLM